MGDPVNIIKEVGLNLATGGLYSVAKAGKASVEQGSIMPLLTQGMDVGLAALGNEFALELGGPKAAMAFNAAGLAAGVAGASGAFSGLPGFAPGGGAAVTPLAATPGATTAPTTLGSNVTPLAASPASTAPVSGTIVDVGAAVPKTNVMSGVGLPATMTDIAPASMSELAGAAQALNAAPSTAGWFAGLSPGAQTALIMGATTGAQMLTGAMGGIFQGVSAQKKLELEQLINEQHQKQVQYKNKNNQYAPLLTFQPPGLINAPR